MVAAANKALSATADGNQKKPGFPGFIPPGANPQQVAAALAARPATNVLAGTGLGLNAAAQAPVMVTDGMGPRPAPQPEPAKKMGWNDVPPLRAPDNARNIYANMGVDDLKSRANMTGGQATTQAPAPQATGTRGLSGLVGSTNDIMPRTRTVMSQSGQSISNLVNNGQYGAAAGEAVRGAAAMFPAVGLDVIAPLAPMGQGMVNATHQYATGESPAVTQAAAPAKTSAPTPTPVSTQPPLRVQEQAAANAATIAAAPQRNAAGALTSLGAGTDVVGAGIKKYVVDGKTLYSNMGDDGPGGNLSLMNRGAPTAQNMAAMDALVNRSTAEGAQAVQRLQFQDQVAQAKAINAMPNPVDPRAAMDVTSPQYQAARLQNMEMRQKTGESPAAYQTRMQAMAESQRLAQTQASGEAELGLRRDTLAANTKQADAKLGIDQQRLGLDGQRLANDQETGSLTRDQKRMEMDQAKKIQALQDKYLTATGAEQEAIGKQLQALAGKESRGDWKLQVTPATKNADGSTSAGSIVRYNERTGAVEQVAGGQGGQAATAGQKYEVGQTVQRADGQKARVIAVDASGQPTKFQPL